MWHDAIKLLGVVSEKGGILFREYCFGRDSSLSSNSVSSAKNSVSSPLHTNNRLRGTPVLSPELGEGK